jgi:hypothetical protein
MNRKTSRFVGYTRSCSTGMLQELEENILMVVECCQMCGSQVELVERLYRCVLLHKLFSNFVRAP